MSVNVNCENVMVFTRDYNGKTLYSLGVSGRKFVDGQKTDEYINAYINAQFTRGNVPQNKERIDVTRGFITAYEGRDGKPGIKLVVQEWTPHNMGDNGGAWG